MQAFNEAAQLMMNDVMKKLNTNKHHFARYVDDFVISSYDLQNHIQALGTIFVELKKHEWTINPNKIDWISSS